MGLFDLLQSTDTYQPKTMLGEVGKGLFRFLGGAGEAIGNAPQRVAQSIGQLPSRLGGSMQKFATSQYGFQKDAINNSVPMVAQQMKGQPLDVVKKELGQAMSRDMMTFGLSAPVSMAKNIVPKQAARLLVDAATKVNKVSSDAANAIRSIPASSKTPVQLYNDVIAVLKAKGTLTDEALRSVQETFGDLMTMEKGLADLGTQAPKSLKFLEKNKNPLPSSLSTFTKNLKTDDIKIMEDFIDAVRLKKPLSKELELGASTIAEGAGVIGKAKNNSQLATKLEEVLNNWSKIGRSVSKDAPLTQEATKYKSAEEFVKAQNTRYATFGDNSRTPQDILDMKASGEFDPISNYDARTQGEWLGKGTKYYTPAENGKVTIYRATEGNSIRAGDYVTNNKAYAEQHLQSVLRGEGKIIEIKNVGLDELNVVNPNEFWYAPKDIKTKSQLTDIWEKAQGKGISGVSKKVLGLTGLGATGGLFKYLQPNGQSD